MIEKKAYNNNLSLGHRKLRKTRVEGSVLMIVEELDEVENVSRDGKSMRQSPVVQKNEYLEKKYAQGNNSKQHFRIFFLSPTTFNFSCKMAI